MSISSGAATEKNKKPPLHGRETEIDPCPLCKGKGFQLLPGGGKQFKPYLDLVICSCVESVCICDKKPPYMYMDQTNFQLLPCICRPVRHSLSLIKNLYAKSNIPPKYKFRRIKEFETYHPDNEINRCLIQALDNAYLFLEELKKKTDFIRGWYFYGPSGSGKTLLSCLILNECILLFQDQVRYTKITRDFFNQMRAAFNQESNFYGKSESLFYEVSNADILVIDDFGVQKDSDWEQRTLYDLIDHRYEYNKTTIITSNIPPKELKPLFGGRIFSRLKEMTRIQDMISTDYRDKFSAG